MSKGKDILDGILIEWDGEIYALWCMRCNKIAVCTRGRDKEEIRCHECNYKLGERFDRDYVNALTSQGGVSYQ